MAATKALTSRIHAIASYLTPLLPIANSHMVEFITREHWALLPEPLRCYLDGKELGEASEEFWRCHSIEGNNAETSELSKWISHARSHYMTVTDQLCLSTDQLQCKIEAWGGTVKHELTVTEFMNQKKSYEVQTMSQLVASLFDATKATCSVEAGGGRGHLQVALCLGYRVPSLTVDCNERALAAAETRARIIKKQWHVIAKRADGSTESRIQQADENIHRFAAAFITRDSDLAGIVRQQFPEHEDTRLLLTGLHTCGDLGPTSLRLFERHSSTAAVFNVPCCYHLLTESNQGEGENGGSHLLTERNQGEGENGGSHLLTERNQGEGENGGSHLLTERNQGEGENGGSHLLTERNQGEGESGGFPMSHCLAGYSLGRNARMLANHSIERMVYHRELPPRSLLYRAMLEAIIQTYAPHSNLATGKLKRISSKADSFHAYFKMADSILKLGLYDTLPDKFLQELIENEDRTWKKLVLYYLMKLCLAQVIECLILLDRIMYLYENGFDDAYLVKLFDPVLSPRCHSIVAVRN